MKKGILKAESGKLKRKFCAAIGCFEAPDRNEWFCRQCFRRLDIRTRYEVVTAKPGTSGHFAAVLAAVDKLELGRDFSRVLGQPSTLNP